MNKPRVAAEVFHGGHGAFCASRPPESILGGRVQEVVATFDESTRCGHPSSCLRHEQQNLLRADGRQMKFRNSGRPKVGGTVNARWQLLAADLGHEVPKGTVQEPHHLQDEVAQHWRLGRRGQPVHLADQVGEGVSDTPARTWIL